jgi:hypothetical protein
MSPGNAESRLRPEKLDYRRCFHPSDDYDFTFTVTGMPGVAPK